MSDGCVGCGGGDCGMSTREINPVDMKMVVGFLQKNLTLETRIDSYYTGGLDGGPLYRDSTILRLILCGEVISEVWV